MVTRSETKISPWNEDQGTINMVPWSQLRRESLIKYRILRWVDVQITWYSLLQLRCIPLMEPINGNRGDTRMLSPNMRQRSTARRLSTSQDPTYFIYKLHLWLTQSRPPGSVDFQLSSLSTVWVGVISARDGGPYACLMVVGRISCANISVTRYM